MGSIIISCPDLLGSRVRIGNAPSAFSFKSIIIVLAAMIAAGFFMSATKPKKCARPRLFNTARFRKLEYSPACHVGTGFLSGRFHEMRVKYSRSLFGRLPTCTANTKSTAENLSLSIWMFVTDVSAMCRWRATSSLNRTRLWRTSATLLKVFQPTPRRSRLPTR